MNNFLYFSSHKLFQNFGKVVRDFFRIYESVLVSGWEILFHKNWNLSGLFYWKFYSLIFLVVLLFNFFWLIFGGFWNLERILHFDVHFLDLLLFCFFLFSCFFLLLLFLSFLFLFLFFLLFQLIHQLLIKTKFALINEDMSQIRFMCDLLPLIVNINFNFVLKRE